MEGQRGFVRRVTLGVVIFWWLWSGIRPASALGFPPFFDHDPATQQAPEPPKLNDFDEQVLKLCGDWGSRVEAADFEAMLLAPNNRERLDRIRQAFKGELYTTTQDRPQFVRELRRIWFEQKGFQHVFCGEPGVGEDLGGLHYVGRYWQAQNRGWAGYHRLAADPSRRAEEKCRRPFLKERLKPPIYALGIEFFNPSTSRNDVKCLGSYHLDMDAESLLIAGTRAFLEAYRPLGSVPDTQSCLVETALPGIAGYYSLVVTRRGALRTFYPMAEDPPYCFRDRKDFRACLCSRLPKP